MSIQHEIITGRNNDADVASYLIYDSSHELFDFMFEDKDTALKIIKKLFKKERGYFSYVFSTVLLSDGDVVGVQLGYDLEQLEKQKLIGGVHLFLCSPMAKWWHILKDVSSVLDEYVPDPSKGSYYINNIAVSSDYRGEGLGTTLLKNILDRAQCRGYRSVELDVTAVNEGAIRFYEKHGFVAVSRSGDMDLYKKHGLPPLLRMIHTFREEKQLQPADGENVNPLCVTDVTGLYSTKVDAVFTPGTVEHLQSFLQKTTTPISIGGGRFSMGGQVAAEGSVHIDMRGLNRILGLYPGEKVIRVQSGTRWRDIQQVIDGYGLAVKIQQTYSDFTVGGSISVNCHGRYIGLGPIIMSVRSLLVMMHDGRLVETSPATEPDIFYSIVGGYGSIGIIIEAELDLVSNTKVERVSEQLRTSNYLEYFKDNVRNNPDAVFHNVDLYPPHYSSANAVTWAITGRPVSTKERLNPGRRLYLLEKYLLWAITETPFGKWRREHIIDPFIFRKKIVHWRNYEAGYHVNELEPVLRDHRTYVLQEYFVPIDQFLPFIEKMGEILSRYMVNVVNISVRHAHKDPGSLLAWAREEVFAFVLYYKQGTLANARECVAVWTRELIDATIEHNGAYYLPYQPHATPAQFHVAYPNASRLFDLKRHYDPNYRFRNCLWQKYYDHKIDAQGLIEETGSVDTTSEFIRMYSDTLWRDNFYRFLQNIYRIYPEDCFHTLIIEACKRRSNDNEIYQYLQEHLPDIKTALSDLQYALPALRKQKAVIASQTKTLVGRRRIDGYLEIGSTGRYVRSLKKSIDLTGPIYLSNDIVPDYSLPEIMERGSVKPVGKFFDLNNYAPISNNVIKNESLGLVTCYIGLHHCLPEDLDAYLASIHRVLRKNGLFILRDHDADSEMMKTFVSLVHTVFNVGLGVSWEENRKEKRFFNSLSHWVEALNRNRLELIDEQLLQDHDPSRNTLMVFVKN